MPATIAPPSVELPVSRIGHGTTADEFRRCFGEELTRAIDPMTWADGVDLVREYARIESEVERAVRERMEGRGSPESRRQHQPLPARKAGGIGDSHGPSAG